MNDGHPYLNISVRIVAVLLFITTISMGVSGLFDTQLTPKAHAVIPTTETNPLVLTPLGILAGTNPVTSASTLGSFTISNVLNGIATALARAAIQAITRSIVMWINSGFKGSPAFVTNLKAYLLATADHIAGTLIAEISGSDFLCSPFRLQLSNALRNQYFGGMFLNRCTLTGIVNNIKNFSVTTNFANSGGWNGWLSLTTSPQNNLYGGYFAASSELTAKLVNSRGESVSLLDWGHGFMSWCGSGGSGQTGQTVNLGDNDELAKGEQSVGIRAAASNPAKSCTNDDGTTGTIQTPGSVIESQLEFQLGSGVRQLELTNSINQIVGALMQQLMMQVLGATGLFGLSAPSAGGGASFVDQLGSTTQPTGNEVPNLIQAISTDEQTVKSYKSDWLKIGGAAADAQTSLTNLADQCSDDSDAANQILTTEVQPVVDESSTNAANADTVFNAFEVIKNEASSSETIDDLGKASADYQTLKNASSTPGIVALSDADAQSMDTGAESPPSTYSHMVLIKQAADTAQLLCTPLTSI